MKQNIMIVSFDYSLSKAIATKIADSFSVRFLDQRELFEFDHIPRTFSEVYKDSGEAYVKKKFRSLVKMETEFDSVVFAADMCLADNCDDLFYKIKLSNFVILLKKDEVQEERELSEKKFATAEERKFYIVDKETLLNRKRIIRENCADIEIDITGLSDESIVSEIEKGIKHYFMID